MIKNYNFILFYLKMYKITYFPLHGRAEPLRMIFGHKKIEF